VLVNRTKFGNFAIMNNRQILAIIAVLCAYLVVTMPVGMAQSINVNFYTPDGATKLPITATLPTPQDLVTKTVSFLPDPTGTLQNVLVKYDIKQKDHAINRGFVWLCKGLDPTDCITQKKEPISIQEFLNKERVWSDVGEITGTYPQKGNVLVLLNLDVTNQAGSSQSVWVGLWDEITTRGANPNQFSIKTNRIAPDSINIKLEKEQFANLTATFINNFYMIPRNWVKEVQIPKVEGELVNTISGTQLDNLDTPQQFGDPHKRPGTDKIQTATMKKQFNIEFPIAVLASGSVIGSPVTFFNNPKAICGEDTDKDGNVCDTNLGEDQTTCCRDCGCASSGTNFTCSFSQISDKDPGVCVNVNDIKLAISDVDTNLVSCETSHDIDFNARITNPPADLSVEEWWYNLDNKTKRTITCNKKIGQEYGCQISVDPLDQCNEGVTVVKNNKLFANVKYAQGSVSKELSVDIPDINLNQRAISQDQIREFIQTEFRKINDDLKEGVEQAKKLMKTCVQFLKYSLWIGAGAAFVTAATAIYEGGKAVGLWDWLGKSGVTGGLVGGAAGAVVGGPVGAAIGVAGGGAIGKWFGGSGPSSPAFASGTTLTAAQLTKLGVSSGATSFSNGGYNYGLNGNTITSVSNPIAAPQINQPLTADQLSLGFPHDGAVMWNGNTYTIVNSVPRSIAPVLPGGMGIVPASLAPPVPVAAPGATPLITKTNPFAVSGPKLTFADFLSFESSPQIGTIVIGGAAQQAQNLALQFGQAFTGTSSALSSASLNICQAAGQIMDVYSRMATAQSFFVKFQLCLYNFDNLMGNGACDGGKGSSPGSALSASQSCMNLLQGCMTDLKQVTNEIKDFRTSLAAQQDQYTNQLPSSRSVDFWMEEKEPLAGYPEGRGRVPNTCESRVIKFGYTSTAICSSPKITKTLKALSQKVDTVKRESGNVISRADTILRYASDFTSTQPGAADIARNRTIDTAKQIDTSARLMKSSSQEQSIQSLADSIIGLADQIIKTPASTLDEFTVKQQALDIRGNSLDIQGLIPDLVKQVDVTGQIINTWSLPKGIRADTVFTEGSGAYTFDFSCGDKTNSAKWDVKYETNCASLPPVVPGNPVIGSPITTPVILPTAVSTAPTQNQVDSLYSIMLNNWSYEKPYRCAKDKLVSLGYTVYYRIPASATYRLPFLTVPTGLPSPTIPTSVGSKPASPVSTGCENPTGNTLPFGILESVSLTEVVGWAMDADDPSRALTVELYVNGAASGTTTANIARSDLVSGHFLPATSVNHGFKFTFTVTGNLNVGDVVKIKAVDPTTTNSNEILDSPKTVGGSPTPLWTLINTTLYQGIKVASTGDRPFFWDPMVGADNYTLNIWDPSITGATPTATQSIIPPYTASGTQLTYTLLSSSLPPAIASKSLFFTIIGHKNSQQSKASNVVGPY